MNALTDIGKLVQVLQEQQSGLLGYEAVLGEISAFLSIIAKRAEMPPVREVRDEGTGMAEALRAALAGLAIPAPAVHVQVAAPQVNFTPPSTTPKGWTFDVTARDDLGRIRQFKLTPEN